MYSVCTLVHRVFLKGREGVRWGLGCYTVSLWSLAEKGWTLRVQGRWLLPSLLPVLEYCWAGGWWIVCPAHSIHLCFEYLQKFGPSYDSLSGVEQLLSRISLSPDSDLFSEALLWKG